MAGDGDPVTVEGKQTDYTFFPGEPLLVSHGSFRFLNKATRTANCVIASCNFVENDRVFPLTDFHVYAGDILIGRTVSIPPASDVDVRVTFPARQVHVGTRFRYAVQLEVDCEGGKHNVASHLSLTQEKPER